MRIEVLRSAKINTGLQDSLEGLEDREQREDEEGERAPADELAALVDDCCQLGFLQSVSSQMENRAQAMTAAPAGSPCCVAKA